MNPQPENPTAGTLRNLLLAIAAFATLVTPIELVFSKHFKEPTMFIPFVLVVITLIAIALVWRRPNPGVLRGFQAVMLLLFVGSALGVFFHLHSNLEIVQEITPDLGGWPLIWKVLSGAAPALAPGLLAQVGLLGLAYTYKHPAFSAKQALAQPSSKHSSLS